MSNAQPSKQELVNALNECQATLKRQTSRILDLEKKLAITEAVANSKASARVTAGWLANDEYKDLRGLLERVLKAVEK